jgi:hypothetical protein
MKKNIQKYTALSGLLICIAQPSNASPIRASHLDREHKTPPFFSKQYDECWKKCDKNNVSLLNDIKKIDEAPHQSSDTKKGDKS